MDYHRVEPAFGDWADVERLAENYYLMFDYMINHISAQSEYYKDFLQKKDASEYRDLFLRYKDFWENGEPTEEQVDAIYKRKPRHLTWRRTLRTDLRKRYGARLTRSRLTLTANRGRRKNSCGTI